MTRVLPGLEQCRGEVCSVTYRQEVKDHIVVLVLQGVAGRQDNVGMSCGLIEVEIDGHHELELGQPLLKLPSVGAGEHGVACYGKHSADLPFPGRQYLFRHYRCRQFITELGKVAHTAVPASEISAIDPRHLHKVK